MCAEKGLTTAQMMRVSGHASERAMQGYINRSKRILQVGAEALTVDGETVSNLETTRHATSSASKRTRTCESWNGGEQQVIQKIYFNGANITNLNFTSNAAALPLTTSTERVEEEVQSSSEVRTQAKLTYHQS